MGAVPAKTWWIIGGAVVAGLAVGSLVGDTPAPSSGGTGYPPEPLGDGEWVDPGAAARIAHYADQISSVTGWGDTLRRYLVPVAYWESRGNSQACHGACTPSSARGWFQLRDGAKCIDWSGLTPDQMLYNERAQVAIAACHAYQLGTAWETPGQHVQTRDVRRGWKFPNWVKQSYRDDPQTFHNRDSYIETLSLLGENASFAYAPMFPPGFYWPGMDAVMGAVNA